MAESSPTLNEWRKLYQAAIRIKEIAPWEWMTETEIFGVQDPESGEIGFVSVMGMLGEHLSLAVYRGARGLYGFWNFEQIADSAPPEAFLEIPHLQASFEDRNELTDKDRAVIKELGLKFRGRQEWPLFRSYRPGYLPWYLEAAEARFLTYALEQAVEVVLRFEEDPTLLEPADEESYLVRVPQEVNGNLVWEDEVVRVPPPEPEPIPIIIDVQAFERVRQLPRGEHALEMDLFLFPAPIREKGARPYFPYLLLVVENQSGLILGNELLTPEPGLAEMWGSVPMKVVHQLARMKVLPQAIKVRSFRLLALLKLLEEELDIEVKATSILPNLDQAKESLLYRFV
ncbi:MAG: DUF7309 domain-containing protein [Anaerolineae bacterium]